MKQLFLKHHKHVSFEVLLHFLDLIPSLLLTYATAAKLSDVFLICPYNILHKLLRPSQFLEKFMKILEWPTLQK